MATPVVVQSNITWTTDGNQEAVAGMYLYIDSSNHVYIGARATGGKFGIIITQAGSQVYTDQDSGNPAKGTDVKIEYFPNHDIKIYYWNGSAWSQIGTTQNYDLGSICYLVLSSIGSTGWNGANPVIIDDVYFSNEEYSSHYPSSPIFSDNFNDNSIDTNKWTETDPNSVVSETSQTLRITTNTDYSEFANRLQSTASSFPGSSPSASASSSASSSASASASRSQSPSSSLSPSASQSQSSSVSASQSPSSSSSSSASSSGSSSQSPSSSASSSSSSSQSASASPSISPSSSPSLAIYIDKYADSSSSYTDRYSSSGSSYTSKYNEF